MSISYKYTGKCSYVAKIIKTLDFSSALTKNIWFYFIIFQVNDPRLMPYSDTCQTTVPSLFMILQI